MCTLQYKITQPANKQKHDSFSQKTVGTQPQDDLGANLLAGLGHTEEKLSWAAYKISDIANICN